jgi:hypothetical protein
MFILLLDLGSQKALVPATNTPILAPYQCSFYRSIPLWQVPAVGFLVAAKLKK